MASVPTRVARIAEALMADRGAVRLVDVLVELGWIAPANVERWMQGRVASLDRCLGVDRDHVDAALSALRRWAEDRRLPASEVDYGDVRFTAAAEPDAERAFRIQWGATSSPEPVVEGPPTPRPLSVIAMNKAWTCAGCGGTDDFLLKEPAGGMCMDCADLGHLEFLPSGDAALTRRATKASRLSAVVVRWSTRRRRYERQGILAEPEAIERAAQECLSDADARERRRAREQSRQLVHDESFRIAFAAAIRQQFPGCPVNRAEAIANHTAARGSGRVGRTAAGRALAQDAVRLAVVASVRHVDTDYDALLMSGVDRESARAQVNQRVDEVIDAWRDGAVMLN